jgi:hypothetical protein
MYLFKNFVLLSNYVISFILKVTFTVVTVLVDLALAKKLTFHELEVSFRNLTFYEYMDFKPPYL